MAFGRWFSKKEVTLAELRDAVKRVAKGKFAGGTIKKCAERLLKSAEVDDLHSELVLHEGDLKLDKLHTGRKPFLGLLIVEGDLVLEGLFQDCLDPESTVIIGGDLRADRLISEGQLEVGGSVIVEREALWRDNDGCAEIFGDLRAGKLLYTKYHAVKIHGKVVAPMILGDDNRFESKSKFEFIDETDDDQKDMLLKTLPREALSIEGDPKGDPDDWCIDYIKDDVLAKLVAAGKPVAATPKK